MLPDNSHAIDEDVQRRDVLQALHQPVVPDEEQHAVRNRVEEDAGHLAVLDALEEQTQGDRVRDQRQDEENRQHVRKDEGDGAPQRKALHNSEDDRDEDQEEEEVDQQSGHFVIVEETSGDLQQIPHATLLLVHHRNEHRIDDVQATKHHQKVGKPNDVHVCGCIEFARGKVLERDLKKQSLLLLTLLLVINSSSIVCSSHVKSVVGWGAKRIVTRFAHRKWGNVLMTQKELIDGDLQLNETTLDVVIVLPIVQLVVVVPEHSVRDEVWGVSVPDRVLQGSGACVVEENRKQVLICIVADRPVQVIHGAVALHS